MKKLRVFVLDDADERHKKFAEWLDAPHIELVQVWTYDQAIKAVNGHDPFDIMYLDHDLNDYDVESKIYDHSGTIYGSFGSRELTGYDFVKYLVMVVPKEKHPRKIIIHSWNEDGAKDMERHLLDNGFLDVKRLPFKT